VYKIRVVQTSSGASAVQVIRYENRKRIVFKHIGSAHTPGDLQALKSIAKSVIDEASKQLALFEADKNTGKFISLEQSEFLGVHYLFLYEALSSVCKQIGLDRVGNKFLLDLVIIRIVEPASKVRSIELLEDYFGIHHRRQNYYKAINEWVDLKSSFEGIITAFAQKEYGFDYSLVFYDVTTLYFETFKADELRDTGFSKDNKPKQPQVVVALMVTKDGFPIGYEVFNGSTFEGHTIIPVIASFIKKHQIKQFTVVADAAMISADNVKALVKSDIHYIVGARLGNLPGKLINKIDTELKREDGSLIRFKTDNGDLICSFSSLRYRKDEYEMKKQIERAQQTIAQPSKEKKLKFTKSINQNMVLNEALIEKTKKLLGIKGYYTDLKEEAVHSSTIIDRYHELYKIEQAFRIAKHDLKTRPIFHYKEPAVQLHLLMCFMALAASKHIELKSGKSIKSFVAASKKVQDARMLNLITRKETKIRTKYDAQITQIIDKLNLPH
jgi:transposase